MRRSLLTAAKVRLAAAERGLAWARKAKRASVTTRTHDVSDLRKLVAKREADVAYAQRVADRNKPQPLGEKAYAIAAAQVGVMESGGNNNGVPFTRYEKANGATAPEAWCGDFQAWCYREAGSTAVTRSWAAVRLLGSALGVSKTTSPERGDLVRYTFDHVGMFVKDNADGTIETIEGNTGSAGAVSDSSTGGDGVYRKRRSKTLVQDYLRVSR